MKVYTLLFGLAIFSAAKAQNVGINQNSPTNSLHITPLNAGDDPLRIDGMQSYVSGDTTLLIIDNTTGIVRYVNKSDLGGMIGDVLFQNTTFLDSLNTFVTNNAGSDTDVDSARVVGNTLQIFENGTMVTADLTNVTGTTYVGGTGIGISGNTITNTAPDQIVSIAGGTGITTSGTYPNFTVTNSAPDQVVSITGATGISATGTYPNFTIANTAPDQTVTITGGTGITTSGTYPNFTIVNSAPDQTVSLTGSGNTTVTGTYPNFTIASTDNQTLGSNATSITLTNGGSVPFSTINAKDWHTNGNAGTNGALDFLGTTDAQPVVFKTNNAKRMEITSGGAVRINTNSSSGVLTVGANTSTAILGFTTSGNGVSGIANSATSFGLYAKNQHTSGTGLIASGNNISGNYLTSGSGGAFTGVDGLYAKGTNATSGTGIIGLGNNLATSFTLTGGSGGAFTGIDGVYAKGANATGTGVVGVGNNITTAQTISNGSGGSFTGNPVGVYGKAMNTGGSGIWGIGVLGDGAQFGVYSITTLGANSTKSFIIDHPLDPENKFLKHYSMESPEVINFYRGNVILDDNGEAIVTLPDYFTAININYSYTLTPIGSYSDTYIAQEIDEDGKFKIAGGNPNQKISWYVYAERNDVNVNLNSFHKAVVVEKTEQQKGKYLNPKAYGKGAEAGLYSPVGKKVVEKKTEEVKEVIPNP